MILNEKKGNLFELDKKYALAHCISLDCEMGKGIAVEFNKRFKGMKRDLIQTIEDNSMSFPCVIMYYDNDDFENSRKVFNLITKKAYYGKPTYQTITKCIEDMANMCKKYNVKYLAMPKIGCGLDRLQWSKVREIIQEAFKDIDIEIEVRYL